MSAPARIASERTTTTNLSLNWSSTALIQQSGNELLVVDAETREWRVQIERSFGNGYAVRLHLPFRTTGAGSLDSAIGRWHDVFGLPNGARSDLPRDRFRLDYRHGTASVMSLSDTSYSGLGDLQLEFGKQLRTNESSATGLWSGISLPTGDADELSGNGGVSGFVAIAHTQRLGSFELFGHVGARFSKSDDPLKDQRRSAFWIAMLGTEYRATRNTSFTMQLDAHGAAFDDHGLDYLGQAYILSFGGQYAFSSQWTLQLGVAEDVKVEASPDVSFLFNLRKRW